MAMRIITRAKNRKLNEEQRRTDRISGLPDDVLVDIVSLLPTKAGGRTQVLSTRWRHIWRSAPLNIDVNLHDPDRRVPVAEISRVLAAHTAGHGHRFSISKGCLNSICADSRTAAMDGWLRSPALQDLQELEFGLNHGRYGWSSPRLRLMPLPASVYSFSSSLRVCTFSSCTLPDGDNGSTLRLPVLEQMTLLDANISDGALRSLLHGSPVLRSLLLLDNYGFCQLQIVSPSLRSIGFRACAAGLQRYIIVDTPCLERLLIFNGMFMEISVISAPRLCILGKPRLRILGELFGNNHWLQFSNADFQRSTTMSTMEPVHSVKVLAISEVNLSMDEVIEILKFFPHLEKFYIYRATSVYPQNMWQRYRGLFGSLDIRLRKIVLANYQGSQSHINFAKLFVANARVLESMRFEVADGSISKAWIAEQRRLLDIKGRASRGARFTFVSSKLLIGSLDLLHVEQVHDLSLDPFERFH